MAKTVEKETTSDVEESGNSINLDDDRDARIAEIAYLKAESRGFERGYELQDWLEAEQELLLK